MIKISELWFNIASGKLPILFDSEHNFMQGISPVSRYSNYASDEKGDYDLSIMGVTADFFEKMEQKVTNGEFKKYDICDDNGDIVACTKKAWEKAWADSKSGELKRSFICHDKINSTQYIFHDDTETCTPVYTEYFEDYKKFYEGERNDIEKAKQTRE